MRSYLEKRVESLEQKCCVLDKENYKLATALSKVEKELLDHQKWSLDRMNNLLNIIETQSQMMNNLDERLRAVSNIVLVQGKIIHG